MTFPTAVRIASAIEKAITDPCCQPVRIWLTAGDYGLLNADAYRQSGGTIAKVLRIEGMPVMPDPGWGQPSRVVMNDGSTIKI